MARVLIGVGSNLGDREQNLRAALDLLQRLPHTHGVQASRWRETPPEGGPPQGPFLNGVAELRTELPPDDFLRQMHGIENSLGRRRNGPRWGPRPIDLDLLAYDDLVLEEPDLTLPHPRLHLRRFVLEPLAEIAPDWMHPRLGCSARQLLESLGCHADPPDTR